MSTNNLEEKIAKLPVWAQEHIKDLNHQRDAAIRALNKFTDEQTESPFSFQEHPCTGEGGVRGPVYKQKFVQAHSIDVDWQGVHLTVGAHDYGNSDSGIKLQWTGARRSIEEVAMIPDAFQSVRLVLPKNLRK